MKFTIHGAGLEVGRSCIEIDTGTQKFLFDCGIKITHHGTEYPHTLDPASIDAVFISHAHLDHSGALPHYHAKGLQCPIFMTTMTSAITQLLLKDSLHVEKLRGYDPIHNEDDIRAVKALTTTAEYEKAYSFDGVNFTFFDAGHIPGSSSVYLHIDDTTILYSGDIKVDDSMLLSGADLAYPPVDVLIVEATYGNTHQKEREEEQDRFLQTVKRVVQRGGTVAIPSFAIGRGQEIIMMLQQLPSKVPIYFDGMGKKALQRFLQHPEFMRNPGLLQDAKHRIHYIAGKKRRIAALRNQGIFVASAGMMDGGPILEYVNRCYHDKRSAILLTGFQACGSNGRLLLDEGKVRLDEDIKDVRCEVQKFEFSAHADVKELHEFILAVKPKTVITNHGDPENCRAVAEWCRTQGMQAYAPLTGAEIHYEE